MKVSVDTYVSLHEIYHVLAYCRSLTNLGEKKKLERIHTATWHYITIFINWRAAATYFKGASLETTAKHLTKRCSNTCI